MDSELACCRADEVEGGLGGLGRDGPAEVDGSRPYGCDDPALIVSSLARVVVDDEGTLVNMRLASRARAGVWQKSNNVVGGERAKEEEKELNASSTSTSIAAVLLRRRPSPNLALGLDSTWAHSRKATIQIKPTGESSSALLLPSLSGWGSVELSRRAHPLSCTRSSRVRCLRCQSPGPTSTAYPTWACYRTRAARVSRV